MIRYLFPILLFGAVSCSAPSGKPEVQQDIYYYTNYPQSGDPVNDTVEATSITRHSERDSLLASLTFEVHGTPHKLNMYSNRFGNTAMNGETTVYELDDLGVIYGKSPLWSTYARLHTTNDSIANLIDRALEQIILKTQ
ncbi:MAG: hypothetical protein V4616_11450 [Bacteroidota bacterium]